MSPYFNLKQCSFDNEKYKRNCARLGFFRDWGLVNSYTIESSCFGFNKNKATETIQFHNTHFLKFGKSLCIAIGKHLDCRVNEIERNGSKVYGLNIELEFAVFIDNPAGEVYEKEDA